MIVGIGIDLVDIRRIEKLMHRFPKRFIERVFTFSERQGQFSRASHHFAKRFAAKEAFLKALGTGLREKISWLDIEIRRLSSGQPSLHCQNRALAFLHQKVQGSLTQIDVSLSDEYPYAQAFVVISTL